VLQISQVARRIWRRVLRRRVVALAGLVALGLFVCSSLRHGLFKSTAMDLGFFDQAIYLISRGETPIVSFWGHHVLGGHGDYSLYLLAGFYRLWADVHWLLAIQGISLALGGVMVWALARQRGIADGMATLLAVAFWAYPLVFNVNLFDFHPEVMAVPGLLAAVWLARAGGSVLGFTALLLFVLGCKAVLSLTVAAMGIWWLLFENRRWETSARYGWLALGLGGVWFVWVTQVLIPTFRPDGVEALFRYGYLGDSLGEILLNLLVQPQLFWGKLVSMDSVVYVGMVVLPVLWGLSWRQLAPLLGLLPTLGLNLLAEHPLQRTLEHQYGVPLLPFLFVAVVDAIAVRGGLWRKLGYRGVMLWCLLAFLLLANPNKLLRGFGSLDTWQATRQAVALVPPEARVLTDNYLAPHLTHRQTLLLLGHPSPLPIDLETPDYVVLNGRHPWPATEVLARDLILHFLQHPEFEVRYQRDEVFVFARETFGQ